MKSRLWASVLELSRGGFRGPTLRVLNAGRLTSVSIAHGRAMARGVKKVERFVLDVLLQREPIPHPRSP